MKRLIVAAIALSVLTGTVAVADSDRRDRGRHERHERDDKRDHRAGRHDRDQRHDRRQDWNDRRDHRHSNHRNDRRQGHYDRHHYERHYTHRPHPKRYKVVRYHPPKGYRDYRWYRGTYLPATYYAPRYVIHDYHSYHLHRPPHGHHWVRVNNDVLLTAIATGLVVQVVNDIFYH